ncbi:macro domain-containing protein [Lentzea sp. BCCO 10_0798]|uniref:Macro domain-containing protein n=1 Tax=Lentzea kristufekii TaxID=3095430 RepID=A0ABU4U6Y0_9PSEU|nr:macro domain-containing protein [Lentzea sp. BCCO 10_0798]MDX8056333.1 macro domain-containing protein [Lentzea sp. BCCO 10_0798]
MGTIEVVLGDITRQRVDIIVTAANESLLGGGGVDGAIHRAAGPGLAEAGARLAPVEPGKAVATPAFGLAPVKHVIHAVGPVWEDGAHGEDEVLLSCYVESILLAEDLRADSIAFPAIATGVHGFPVDRAARIAALAVRSMRIIDEVRLVAFDQETCDALTRSLAEPIVEWCPTCGEKAIPLVFGRPVGEVAEAADAGLVALGGCFVTGDGTDPDWQCPQLHRWTNGERDEHRNQAAVFDAVAVTLGNDRGWSVP